MKKQRTITAAGVAALHPPEPRRPGGNGRGPEQQDKPTTNLQLARLVYLISRYQVKVPREIARYLPAGEWLMRLHGGPSSAGFTSQKLLQRFEKLIERGKQMGPGTREEVAILVLRLLDEAALRREDISPEERVILYARAEAFIRSTQSMLNQDDESPIIDLATAKPGPGVPKFNTGFDPLDQVLGGGAYQGIIIWMGKPGDGKTTLLLSLAEAIVLTDSAHSILYVENELPRDMMLGRMSPILNRTAFRPQDKLVCASWNSREIENFVNEYPDPDRIILYDSPDVTAGEGEEKRYALEAEYKNLIRLKQNCKAIFTSSWPRRKDARGVLTMESVAEAWAKAWYADAIVGIARLPQGVRFTALKNRFGVPDLSVLFPFDYETLEWGDSKLMVLCFFMI